MSGEPVIAVCGFGRCGSSLVMQMLAAAGVPVTGRPPSYEAEQTSTLSFDSRWLTCQGGRAVKLLDPHLVELPDMRYRFIWLDRDRTQQSRSQIKLLEQLGGVVTQRGHTRRAFARSNDRDRPLALRYLHRRGPILRLRFEELLEDPAQPITRLVRWVDVPVERELEAAKAMFRQIVPRDAGCRPDMDLELGLMARRTQIGGTG